MSERFRQFQALFPEEACLAALMRLRHGGTSLTCPACGRQAAFEPRPKLRGFACEHCNYMIHPAAGTPLESRRTPLQLWFYALKTLTEQPGKGAVGVITREAHVPQLTAQRLVDELTALAGKGDAGWLEGLRRLVTGKSEAAPVPAADPVPVPLRAPPPAPVAANRAAPSPPAAPTRPVAAAPVPAASPQAASRKPATEAPDAAEAPEKRPKKASSAGRAIALVAAGVACVTAAVLGLAYARLQQQDRPEPVRGIEVAEVEAPALKAAPARPSLILSSVEQDLEGARQAAQFALDNDPSLAAIKPQEEAPSQQVPVNQLQLPSNILLVPPKMQSGPPAGPVSPSGAPQPPPMISSGDPDQVLTFGPIKIRRHLVDTIVRASKVVGADPTLLMAVADKESSFSTAVKAQTSSATGLYQFIEQTWLGVIYEFGTKHGLAAEAKLIGKSGRQFVVGDAAQRQRILDMRREPYISALLAAEMLKRDTLRLERALGRHLTGGEIYLIHFLGPDAAQTFIETMEEQPGVKAAELLPKPAQANRPIFYADAGGETKVLSVSEVHKKFNDMIKVRLDRYSVVRPGQGPGIARPQPKK
ncbi:transglycosylase SLT domain-containing protein [Bosea sp. (in: a-proteobacteria)]|uniref:transglycosylase SLT domain-containing protein n=1 Tax=Bosea sp. (in: a-proteobacteria) TaxID=1871050 RepID=UPI002608AA1C|nr:transglycosylase SLT domain-containing protein [Bosea sp. (in: a-proteobacteria)]MCO5093531.1 transglycosylase SLT domain-containing protein [Bosea sp. (in: a-proteobacteria)]